MRVQQAVVGKRYAQRVGEGATLVLRIAEDEAYRVEISGADVDVIALRVIVALERERGGAGRGICEWEGRADGRRAEDVHPAVGAVAAGHVDGDIVTHIDRVDSTCLAFPMQPRCKCCCWFMLPSMTSDEQEAEMGTRCCNQWPSDMASMWSCVSTGW